MKKQIPSGNDNKKSKGKNVEGDRDSPKHAGANRGISRKEILKKYWELANLDPEATKGTITGQLKALDSLLEQMQPAVPREAGAGEPDIYRSAWLRRTRLPANAGEKPKAREQPAP